MIDRIRIHVKAGDGGNGIVSFRREKFVPFGGPNGGDGGDGGDVYLEGDESKTTLLDFEYQSRFIAKRGDHGKGKDMHGRRGDDLVLRVPLGTQVRAEQGEGGDELMADIVEAGQRVLVAKGGKGGFGNAHYATSTNQAPRTAQRGHPGEEVSLRLDLKLIADVGIAGYPNAGKSTLLSRSSRARPKIADYPFTTLEPVLGVVRVGHGSFVMADIPGLIEGAHQGAGLGLDFLRHIERTRVIIQMVDGGSADPAADLASIEREMAAYDPGMIAKKRVIAVNKIDLPEVQARLPEIEKQLEDKGLPLFFISAATGEGVDELMNRALELLSQVSPERGEAEEAGYKVYRPRPVSAGKKGRHAQGHG